MFAPLSQVRHVAALCPCLLVQLLNQFPFYSFYSWTETCNKSTTFCLHSKLSLKGSAVALTSYNVHCILGLSLYCMSPVLLKLLSHLAHYSFYSLTQMSEACHILLPPNIFGI